MATIGGNKNPYGIVFMKLRPVLEILIKEWLLFLSAGGLILVSAYSGRVPKWSLQELQVLYFLFLLFVMVKGLENSGLLRRLALAMENGRAVAVKMLVLTFLLSMLVTNDVALIVIVPLTLLLNIRRRDVLVIMEALAANAGSALTPIGNPQNLFIYWYYRVPVLEFIQTIAPLVVGCFVLLMVAALSVRSGDLPALRVTVNVSRRRAYGYLAGLLIVILSLLHLLPVWSAGLVIVFVVVFDRRSLAVDYILLLTFVCLFGLADSLDAMLRGDIGTPASVFWYTALASQVISNVPATVLLARLTDQWQLLLWGASVGGFGSLVGSLANVIAYRLYLRTISLREMPGFTVRFIAIGYLAFVIGVGLFLLWHGTK